MLYRSARQRTNVICVTGTAKEAMRPDLAEFTAGVEVQGDNPTGAMNGCSRKAARVIEALVASGLPRKHIQTSRLALHPMYSEATKAHPATIVRYRAVNQVECKCRELDRVGEFLGVAVSNGATGIHSLSFRVDDSEALLTRLAREAVRNAKARAEALASAAGVELGPVVRMELSLGRPDSSPWSHYMGAYLAEPPQTPLVEPGEVTGTAAVEAMFAIGRKIERG